MAGSDIENARVTGQNREPPGISIARGRHGFGGSGINWRAGEADPVERSGAAQEGHEGRSEGVRPERAQPLD